MLQPITDSAYCFALAQLTADGQSDNFVFAAEHQGPFYSISARIQNLQQANIGYSQVIAPGLIAGVQGIYAFGQGSALGRFLRFQTPRYLDPSENNSSVFVFQNPLPGQYQLNYRLPWKDVGYQLFDTRMCFGGSFNFSSSNLESSAAFGLKMKKKTHHYHASIDTDWTLSCIYSFPVTEYQGIEFHGQHNFSSHDTSFGFNYELFPAEDPRAAFLNMPTLKTNPAYTWIHRDWDRESDSDQI